MHVQTHRRKWLYVCTHINTYNLYLTSGMRESKLQNRQTLRRVASTWIIILLIIILIILYFIPEAVRVLRARLPEAVHGPLEPAQTHQEPQRQGPAAGQEEGEYSGRWLLWPFNVGWLYKEKHCARQRILISLGGRGMAIMSLHYKMSKGQKKNSAQPNGKITTRRHSYYNISLPPLYSSVALSSVQVIFWLFLPALSCSVAVVRVPAEGPWWPPFLPCYPCTPTPLQRGGEEVELEEAREEVRRYLYINMSIQFKPYSMVLHA